MNKTANNTSHSLKWIRMRNSEIDNHFLPIFCAIQVE